MKANLEPKWPVAEVFGPTIQGEGIDQGSPCHFVRFGGCDYRCSWCDTPYAVLPDEVRQLGRRTASELITELAALPPRTRWVILTGGNPLLHDLRSFVDKLKEKDYLVAVETQGSLWKAWLQQVDRVCISFKPPSSGMERKSTLDNAERFLARISECDLEPRTFVKVVVFDSEDLRFATQVKRLMPDGMRLYLSAGNDPGRTVSHPDKEDIRGLAEVRKDLLDSTSTLAMAVVDHPIGNMDNVFVQNQLHTALWGNGRGF